MIVKLADTLLGSCISSLSSLRYDINLSYNIISANATSTVGGVSSVDHCYFLFGASLFFLASIEANILCLDPAIDELEKFSTVRNNMLKNIYSLLTRI